MRVHTVLTWYHVTTIHLTCKAKKDIIKQQDKIPFKCKFKWFIAIIMSMSIYKQKYQCPWMPNLLIIGTSPYMGYVIENVDHFCCVLFHADIILSFYCQSLTHMGPSFVIIVPAYVIAPLWCHALTTQVLPKLNHVYIKCHQVWLIFNKILITRGQ